MVDTPDGPLTIVRERNAHAWVEVWLDGQGWVGFDPTRVRTGRPLPGRTVGIDFDRLSEEVRIGEADLGGTSPTRPGPGDGGSGSPREGPAGPAGATPVLAAMVAVLVAVAALPGDQGVAGACAEPARATSPRCGTRSSTASPTWGTAVTEPDTDRVRHLHGPGAGAAGQAYSTAVYGGRQPDDVDEYLYAAGQWLDEAFERSERTRAVFSLRSLRR